MPSGEGLGSVPSLASTASLTRALPTCPRRYESIGWNMQRFNSNVHREASLTITVGATDNTDKLWRWHGVRATMILLVPSGSLVEQMRMHYGWSK